VKCLYCSNETKVVNSRLQKRQNTTWRRRQCQNCKAIFTTHEQVDLDSSMSVVKYNGEFEPFNGQKLRISIYDCLKHRKSVTSDSESIYDTIISKIINTIDGPSIKINDLQSIVTNTLKNFDSASAVHYSAYYIKN
jgi:transcriptional repressor NrdR